jgi:spore germination protein GerM
MTKRLASVVLCLLAVAACGVPIDKEPQAISRTTTTTTVTPTTNPSPGAREVAVYFLQNDHLVAQSYPVTGRPTLAQAITFALQPPVKGAPASLRTAVPPDTRLLSAELSSTGTVATIDLGQGISSVNGESQKQAFAQLVFTALAFGDVRQVQFAIDGKPVDAPTDGANKRRVSGADYDSPLHPS